MFILTVVKPPLLYFALISLSSGRWFDRRSTNGCRIFFPTDGLLLNVVFQCTGDVYVKMRWSKFWWHIFWSQQQSLGDKEPCPSFNFFVTQSASAFTFYKNLILILGRMLNFFQWSSFTPKFRSGGKKLVTLAWKGNQYAELRIHWSDSITRPLWASSKAVLLWRYVTASLGSPPTLTIFTCLIRWIKLYWTVTKGGKRIKKIFSMVLSNMNMHVLPWHCPTLRPFWCPSHSADVP